MKTTTSSSPSFRSCSAVPGSTATTLSRRQLDPLGRLAEVHGQRARRGRRRPLPATWSAWRRPRAAGRVAPDPRARLLQPGRGGEVGGVPGRVALASRRRRSAPRSRVLAADDVVAHPLRSSQLGSPDVSRRRRTSAPASSRSRSLLAAALSMWVYWHASRHGSRHATAWGVADVPRRRDRPARLLHPLLPDPAAVLMAAQEATPRRRGSRAAPAAAAARGADGRAARRRDDPLLPAPLLPDAPARALVRGGDAADRRVRPPPHRAARSPAADVTSTSRPRCSAAGSRSTILLGALLLTASYIVGDRARHRGEADRPSAGRRVRRRRAGVPAGAAARAAARAARRRLPRLLRLGRAGGRGRGVRRSRTRSARSFRLARSTTSTRPAGSPRSSSSSSSCG